MEPRVDGLVIGACGGRGTNAQAVLCIAASTGRLSGGRRLQETQPASAASGPRQEQAQLIFVPLAYGWVDEWMDGRMHHVHTHVCVYPRHDTTRLA